MIRAIALIYILLGIVLVGMWTSQEKEPVSLSSLIICILVGPIVLIRGIFFRRK